MISDPADDERSLYVGLSRHTSTRAQPVGLVKLARRGVMESGEFAYGLRYLQTPTAEPLNPDHLPLQAAAFTLPDRRVRDGGALPLTLRDALPDSWGRKVLEIQHGGPLSDVDALLLTNEDRVGAMVFSETLPMPADTPATDLLSLEDLAEASRRIEAGLEVTPRMQQLLRGGSLGGARPKATFIREGRRHIAKFASRGDEVDMEIIEAATMGLAAACDITVPPRLLAPLTTGHALLLERFDRTGPVTDERRFHYLSASALLNVPYESSDGSYMALAQALRRLSARPEQDVTELFRRMVFNLVVGNSDDHVKNHGVLHQGQDLWRLSPAFDLVAQLGSHAGYQGLAILPGRHASSLSAAREAAPHFGLAPARADEVIRRIADTVASQAAAAVRALGGTAALAQRLTLFIAQQAERIAA
ncbi:type II toxin-antitoxin system HipA family toxin [Variovorax sp. PAMC 28711]|uniref:type II toxin-antitoxin system HipA family toxin n=1 Tax=Variovorax sp. PAMC 28711 TaxID=1795631 RepID=UPI00078E5094|nr:HipA domain-containing protein [Variovorax sp. PAMC 28711]AMM23380.1 phosphatidylinositol kinase [Variovorax sp. PAMC 28711]